MKVAMWIGQALLMMSLPVFAQTIAYEVVGDAIPASLTGMSGDAAKGRAVVANRQVGLCLLCHSGPLPEERPKGNVEGNLAPSLAGAGSRWTEGQLRLRLADSKRLNPETIMPAYHVTSGLTQVAKNLQGQPLLTAQQIEDVLAFLMTLKQ